MHTENVHGRRHLEDREEDGRIILVHIYVNCLCNTNLYDIKIVWEGGVVINEKLVEKLVCLERGPNVKFHII
jgi:hypothetical protein